MLFPRSSGVLLHPTSLPGRYGIGDLGKWAYYFIDYLISAGQSIWQMLPLGPTSYGDSPYQSLSAFAGNPLLISIDELVEEGWLLRDDIASVPPFPEDCVEYGDVIIYHEQMLHRAFENFDARASDSQRKQFEAWCAENTSWLEDFALFVALKSRHGGKPWVEWPEGEALRDPQTMIEVKARYAKDTEEQSFRQWVFFRQWEALKQYAGRKGLRLVGDIPIFVAHDSADVWANRELFYLDDRGNPTVVAGVPPDYFSETGQRWGNPLYRWDELARDGHSWWIRRFKATLQLVDIVRIDHFRGFEAYWEVPASEPTAIKGRWMPGPGMAFFEVIRAALSGLPIIAEDLGVITPGVEALRDGLKLPGMRVLQFAWGDVSGTNDFLPHNFVPNTVVYTGTHDNNTTLGWWQSGEASPEVRKHVTRYLSRPVYEPHWEMIRLAMSSVAHTCVIPMQDVLSLGEEARMNTPGKASGNWQWRFLPIHLENHRGRQRLEDLTRLYARWPGLASGRVDHSRTDEH